MPFSVYRDVEPMPGIVRDVNCLFAGFHHDSPPDTFGEALTAGMLDNVRIVWTCRDRLKEARAERI